jgi:diguanylate cyclase (GGDEF)-like protein
MEQQIARRRLPSEESTHLYARLVLLGLLAVLYQAGVMDGAPTSWHTLYLVALAIFAATTLGISVAVLALGIEMRRALMVALLFDMVGVTILTFLGRSDDSFYAGAVLMVIVYSIVVSRAEAWLVSSAFGVCYFIGHLVAGVSGVAADILLVSKAASIVVIGGFVAESINKAREREFEAEQQAFEKEELNDQLERRLGELQAVSAITERIHASLDFDEIGPQVLDVISRAIGIESCCLFVIDQEKSETLFTATRGAFAGISGGIAAGLLEQDDERPLTCIPLFEHGALIVTFCATATELRHLSAEDRLVLNAVASELVVAVENSRLYKLAKRLSVTDELTGLSNYRYLQQRLAEEVVRARRYSKPVSLIMMDVDDFKRFNDSLGHVAGDTALAEIGQILRASVREVDLAARYGGEEFSVVLPETDAAGAYIVAEKIREAIATHVFADHDGVRVTSLSASLGLATFPTHAADLEELLRIADDAVYHAKASGKNRVRTPRVIATVETEVAAPDAATQLDEWTGE